MQRRDFLKAGVGAVVLGALAAQEPADAAKRRTRETSPGETPATAVPASSLALWYARPAQEWLEAQPVGNGRLGAMVYGGTEKETIQLNESTVWAGSPHNYDSPDALTSLPEIRKHVFANEWAAAQDLVNAHFMGRPVKQAQYQTVGALTLDLDDAPDVSEYRRELDLDTATVRVSYRSGGVRYTREVFASTPDRVIVVRLTCDKPGAIAFGAAFASPQQSAVSILAPDTLALDGVAGAALDNPGSIKFTALARVLHEGGTVSASGAKATVAGADAVTILISMASSYHSYKDVGGDARGGALTPLDAAARKSYAELRGAHLADYQPLFRRLSLDLGASNISDRPTDERIATFHQDQDPALVSLYCQFGRYLLISCSRAGSQPATLQGLWNDSMDPPWGSKYTVNINTEMNYWPAGPGNLAECYDPLFDLIQDISETGAKTAKSQYGAGGWVCHHNTDAWRGTAPVDGAFWGMWPTGGAWLCKSIWDHYQFTGDRSALAKNYPLMRGAAQFFLDTLVEEPTHKWLVTNPSISPENAHHHDASICAGPTMDGEILRDLFDACANAAQELGKDGDFRNKVMLARARLAPIPVGHLGQLQEWLADWDASATEQNHRHVSHLYGLYPSNQITRRATPELFAAARKSLETRGDESTGWAMAWRINLWARLEDGDHAFHLISGLISPERTAPNMFDLHPPFQIDGNFGGSAGILELLLRSQDDEICLLPALPSALPKGQVKGLRARGVFEVDIEWAEGRLVAATIHSLAGVKSTVRYGDKVQELSLRRGQTIWLGADFATANISA
ncbi:alpha/beta hydrolase [Capsulimonas corticalis]|uniref:Alpha/beta hydrolase n=1 Tax=Capsulimonas corticalis TaxID=2219043 RepID=A0A402D4G6_9BACT|nr:glycoside hydrolase family 95 protein [Capsulimonas corticalis]BDI29298.1 alpha/beta hydrolase [Capsulimonas corticalis]